LGDFNFEDMKGVSIMKVEDMVKVAVKGMQTDRFCNSSRSAESLKMMIVWRLDLFETNEPIG